ncbi:MAG: carboxypeptidase-like regulatory domain-containing protein [Candidatus Limnocylindria bacterium]
MSRILLLALLAVFAACGQSSDAVAPTSRPPGTLIPTPAPGRLAIYGTVTDAETGRPVEGACITLGPPVTCWAPSPYTDARGSYLIDLSAILASRGGQWEIYVLHEGYRDFHSGAFVVNGPVRIDVELEREP